jgi:hypothetical protein
MTAVKRTREESAEEQMAKVIIALGNMETVAKDFASAPNGYNRARLSNAALAYARRVRRIAGVR